MKVAMISTPFVSVPPKEYGGTELIVHELVEGLVARGHDVTLFATHDSVTSAKLRSLYEHPLWPPDAVHDLNHVAWAMQEVRDSGEFDIVHAHSAVALAISRFMPEIPLVYTIHHVREELFSSLYEHYPRVQYVAISSDQAARETRLPHLRVIHHGLDPSKYEWRAAADDYLCFIGRFSEVKGPHVAIEVADRAGLPIRIAGRVHEADGDFGAREVEPRLARPHVQYVGSVGLDRKRPLLRDARALLMPISWNEPFGLVMIEAMLSGCPVVAFPRGSVPELVEEGVTGFVVREEDEMVEVVRRGGRLEGFDRQRCRERAVERFSSSRMVAEHERLYRSVLTGPGTLDSGAVRARAASAADAA